MTNLIVGLPRGLAASILSKYLTVKSIVSLDDAFCVVKDRASFLELLSCSEYKLKEKTTDNILAKANVEDLVKWSVLRSVKLGTLQWTKKVKQIEETLLVQFLHLTIPSIEELLIETKNLHPFLVVQLLNMDCLKVLRWSIPLSPECSELLTILARAPMLEEIHMSKCRFGSSIDTKDICCPNVRFIAASGEWHGGSELWLKLLFPNVTEMEWNVEGSRTASKNVICSFPMLEKLVYYQDMADSLLINIVDACPLLVKVQLLSGKALTDAGIDYLCSKCIHLESIHIWSDNHITSASLNSMSRRLTHNLRELTIGNCNNIKSVAALTACTKLHYINISNSPALNAQSIIDLFTSCTTLREVYMENIATVSDTVLFTLATHSPQLQELHLHGATGFSHTGLQALATHATALRKLCLDTDNGELSEQLRADFQAISCQVDIGSEDDDGDGDWLSYDNGEDCDDDVNGYNDVEY